MPRRCRVMLELQVQKCSHWLPRGRRGCALGLGTCSRHVLPSVWISITLAVAIASHRQYKSHTALKKVTEEESKRARNLAEGRQRERKTTFTYCNIVDILFSSGWFDPMTFSILIDRHNLENGGEIQWWPHKMKLYVHFCSSTINSSDEEE